MFKLALSAGHYKYTAGKHCLKALDPNKTREWVLNDRIADKIEKLLSEYEGYELLRVDDTAGEKNITLNERTSAANKFGADFYLSIHHNAGINGGSGGGIVAYTYTKVSTVTKEWQRELYDALIAKTGLRGNRSTPLASSNLAECRQTTMPAVLLELGFMDSAADVPIILSEDFANKAAEACVEVIVRRGGLTKKIVEVAPQEPQTVPEAPKELEPPAVQETETVPENTKPSQQEPEEIVKANTNVIAAFFKFIINLIKTIWKE